MRFTRVTRSVAPFCLMSAMLFLAPNSLAQAKSDDVCFRGALGSAVPEPEDLYSKDGELRVELAFRSFVDSQGLTRYCYIEQRGVRLAGASAGDSRPRVAQSQRRARANRFHARAASIARCRGRHSQQRDGHGKTRQGSFHQFRLVVTARQRKPSSCSQGFSIGHAGV